MTAKSKKKPEIRFKGFDDEWEEKKFSEHYKMCSGYAFKYQDYIKDGVAIINGESIQHGEIRYDNLNYLPVSFKELYSNFLINEGDIVVGLNRPITNGYLKIAKIPMYLDGSFLYQRAGKIDNKSNIDKDFSFVILEREILKHTLKEAIGSDQPFISISKLNIWKILFPSESTEQIQIGCFFQKLDQLISLQQAKHSKLQNLKKAMLEKMFPQAGSTVPEIRFQGFTEPWIEKKLGDIALIVGGGTPSTGISEYWDGHLDWYSPTEIGKKVYASGSVKKITTLGYEKCSAQMLPPYRTILFTSRAGIGDMAILAKEGCTNQGFQSLVIHDEVDPYFIYSSGQLIKEYAIKNASGSTFLEISGKQLANMDIKIPLFQEQQKIGSYFQKLDKLINLQQTELEKLKNLKKACLEKMFV